MRLVLHVVGLVAVLFLFVGLVLLLGWGIEQVIRAGGGA